MEETEDSLILLKISSPEFYKESDSDYITYIKQSQKYINLNYRIKEGYDAKMLHPLPKNK